MFISAPLHATEHAGLEMGPTVEMNQAADQIPLCVPGVEWGPRIRQAAYLYMARFLCASRLPGVGLAFCRRFGRGGSRSADWPCANLMRTLHMDTALLQRQKPFREPVWTLRP